MERLYVFEGWTNIGAAAQIHGISVNRQQCPGLPIAPFRYERGDLKDIENGEGLVLIVKAVPEWSGSEPEVLLQTGEGEFRWPWSCEPAMHENIQPRLRAWCEWNPDANRRLYQHLFEAVASAEQLKADVLFEANRMLWWKSVTRIEGCLDSCCWVASRVLLLRWWSPVPLSRIRQAVITGNNDTIPLSLHTTIDIRSDIPDPSWGHVGIASADQSRLAALHEPVLLFLLDDGSVSAPAGNAIRPRGTLDAAHFRHWHTEAKRELLEAIFRLEKASQDTPAGSDMASLPVPAESAVEVLDEACPNHLSRFDGALQMVLDHFQVVRSDLVFLAGWLFDPKNSVASLALRGVDGRSIEIDPLLIRIPRPDVTENVAVPHGIHSSERYGFLAAVPTEYGYWDRGARLAARLRSGESYEIGRNRTTWDALETRRALLACMPEQPYFDQRLMKLMQRALSDCRDDASRRAFARVIEYGETPRRPATSIIVTLHRRIDFLRHQMAHFVGDTTLAGSEFVYVLDSPEMEREFAALAMQVFDTYRVPFRGVFLRKNSGFGPANNIGAGLAHGRNLLFMNSDVFPCRPGWLPAMTAAQRSVPHVGLVGGKLLYEDGSLQHAGMYFSRSSNPDGLWWNWHYYKGLPSVFEPANQARAVPAITGALVLIDRALFEDLGGWDESYLEGDFEDSDLSIRLYQRGLCSWYQPSVELWHLERQSQAPTFENAWRRNATYYNCWVQTERWSGVIEEIMRRVHGSEEAEHQGRGAASTHL
ncbi:MAG TPA: glycosyltransferase family 2 protein [Bryobacteraceae bacterium]|nr:glycosyltransferase family 2 protein [Bryobacteraceae bacterium]